MNEPDIVSERKKKVFDFFGKNNLFSNLIIFLIISVLLGIFSLAGVIAIPAIHFVLLSLAIVLGLIFEYFKKTKFVWFPCLLWTVWIAVYIRTRNLPILKDSTTGTWTLGPDLDPFLFLRWAKYIVENGSLYAVDMMRYVPLGYNTSGELPLTHYFIAWLYKISSPIGFFDSVTHAAIIYPVIMFALTVVALFFLARRVLREELGTLAEPASLLAALILTVLPALLPRTIAGIPEKEAGAFLFMILTFYFFISAWKSKERPVLGLIFAIFAGLATAIMALIWGGYTFIYLTIGPAVLLEFIMGKVRKKETIIYFLWIITSFLAIHPFSSRYTFKELVTSIDTGSAFGVLCIILLHQIIFNTKLKEIIYRGKISNIPRQFVSLILGGILLVIGSSLVFGISFIPTKITFVLKNIITPSANRLLQTVAENQQPYFSQWAGNFGPSIFNMPIIFWLFFVGSIVLFYSITKSLVNRKDRFVLSATYVIFLFGLVFSRYASDGLLNGTNFLSNLLYAGSFILFVSTLLFYIYKYDKKNESGRFHDVDFGIVLLLTFFFISIVAARSASRTIMVLVPAAAIISAYLVLYLFKKAYDINSRNKIYWLIGALVIGLFCLFAVYNLYIGVENSAAGFGPVKIYDIQWQGAMKWVRENTSENAVFAHWWDYGYWIQSIGERATVLDGGNAISYWNHLMGRYALTGTSSQESAEFLYAHNVTHFLIDSSDIPKYGAFSSIGSNVNYDRVSSIPTIYKDPQQTQVKKNSTLYVYTAGQNIASFVEEDIFYNFNGSNIFLPAGNAAFLGAVYEENSDGLVGPVQGVFIYNNQQYFIPLRYAYYRGELVNFNGGLESGVFFYPRAVSASEGIQIDNMGAALYLSNRTINSRVARLYLFNEEDPYFKLVHNEDNQIIRELKSQAPLSGDFLDYYGLQGPIKIWEVRYPSNITYKPEYISTEYPLELLYNR